MRTGFFGRFDKDGGDVEILQRATQRDDVAWGRLDGGIRRDEPGAAHAVALLEVCVTVVCRDEVAAWLRDVGDEGADFEIHLAQGFVIGTGMIAVFRAMRRIDLREFVCDDVDVGHGVGRVVPQVWVDLAVDVLAEHRLRQEVRLAAGDA